MILSPIDTGRKLNVHKTFRRRPGRLLNVLCTFNLCPVSIGSIARSFSQRPLVVLNKAIFFDQDILITRFSHGLVSWKAFTINEKRLLVKRLNLYYFYLQPLRALQTHHSKPVKWGKNDGYLKYTKLPFIIS